MNKLMNIIAFVVFFVLIAIGTGAIWLYASPVYTVFEKCIITAATIAFTSLPMMIVWDCKD